MEPIARESVTTLSSSGVESEQLLFPENSTSNVKPLDQNVPIFQQLNTELSPVGLVNVLQVCKQDIASLLEAWEADAPGMKLQPGYISTQLHRGVAGSTVFLSYALWKSVAHFGAAFDHPVFKRALGHHPSSAVASRHLFTRLAVPNLCVGP